MKNDDTLLQEFVATFDKLSDMAEYADIHPIVSELAIGELDDLGMTHWKPSRVDTEHRFLDQIYSKLPGRLPPLFEKLLLSYRWAEVDLQLFTLIANPPGSDLSRFFQQISKDRGLWESLIPAGYIQFAKGRDYDYDLVCFDVKRHRNDNDCPGGED